MKNSNETGSDISVAGIVFAIVIWALIFTWLCGLYNNAYGQYDACLALKNRASNSHQSYKDCISSGGTHSTCQNELMQGSYELYRLEARCIDMMEYRRRESADKLDKLNNELEDRLSEDSFGWMD